MHFAMAIFYQCINAWFVYVYTCACCVRTLAGICGAYFWSLADAFLQRRGRLKTPFPRATGGRFRRFFGHPWLQAGGLLCISCLLLLVILHELTKCGTCVGHTCKYVRFLFLIDVMLLF
jgi:hypothetical protein